MIRMQQNRNNQRHKVNKEQILIRPFVQLKYDGTKEIYSKNINIQT